MSSHLWLILFCIVTIMEASERLAKNLNALKKRHHYGNRSLAAKADVGEGAVGSACRADVSVTLGNLEKIAAVFGLYAWQLIAPEFEIGKALYANHIPPEEERRFRQLEQAADAIGRLK